MLHLPPRDPPSRVEELSSLSDPGDGLYPAAYSEHLLPVVARSRISPDDPLETPNAELEH